MWTYYNLFCSNYCSDFSISKQWDRQELCGHNFPSFVEFVLVLLNYWAVLKVFSQYLFCFILFYLFKLVTHTCFPNISWSFFSTFIVLLFLNWHICLVSFGLFMLIYLAISLWHDYTYIIGRYFFRYFMVSFIDL